MKPDETPPAGQPNSETPPASLTAVRVGRRKAASPASGKAGDLTQKLGADAPADTSPATAAAPVVPLAPVAAAPAPPAAEPTRPAAPPSVAAEPPRADAPSLVRPRPPTRLLGEDEIRQLLDPPERRATPAPEPPAMAAQEPEPAPVPAPPPEPPLMVAPGERDDVPPAPTAPELRLVVEPPAAAPKAEAAPEHPPSAAPPSSIDQIIDYWDGLRDGKPFPPLNTLDRSHVGRWPNCMLVAYGANDTVMPRITRIGEENGDIEYLEMVIHWILSRGRIAARKGEPMEEEKRFPVTGGNARYQLLLLPLATAEGKSEHVLCHLARVKEVAKPKGGAFKRWLAS